jgi:hypothetical protein
MSGLFDDLPTVLPTVLGGELDTSDILNLVTFANASERYSEPNPVTGAIVSAAAGQPLIVTVNGVRYLQCEAASTNNSTYTSDVSRWNGNALLSKIRGYLDPAGALGATRIIGNTSVDAHSIKTNTCNVSEFSAYVKSAGYDYVMVLLYHGAVSRMIFSILNGTGYVISDSGSKIVSYGSNLSANGFRRIWIKTIGGSSTNNQIGIARDSSTFEWSADGISGIDIWNPQYEESHYPTSPILTSGVPITRAKDEALIASNLVSQQLRDRWQWSGYLGMASTQLAAGDKRYLLHFADSGANVCGVYVSGTDLKVHVDNSNGADAILSAALTWTAATKCTVTGIRAAGTLTVAGPTGGSTVTGSAWNRPDGALYLNMNNSLANQEDGIGRVDIV